ncbi:MAG: tryptophan synthase subunit alpha [Candidatus Hodarchaeota archaeon]
MNRLEKTFNSLKARDERAFIPFFVAGDPTPDLFLDIIKNIEPHADIIELGIPYTDPIADGPVIQEANKRAFDSGMNLSKAFELIQATRNMTEKPIVILTYANVVGVNEKMGETLSRFKEAGVDGIIVADIPIEESETILDCIKEFNMDFIFLAAPTTTPERLERIVAKARGFLYLVAVKGVTGARDSVLEETSQMIQRITAFLGKDKSIPICVGFGISKPEHVMKIIKDGADGAIVGSAIIRIIEQHANEPAKLVKEVKNYIESMKEATKN